MNAQLQLDCMGSPRRFSEGAAVSKGMGWSTTMNMSTMQGSLFKKNDLGLQGVIFCTKKSLGWLSLERGSC